MKALILAAGRGTRMRPLTVRTPKPLLRAGGKRLIEWHLETLAAAGVGEVVINTSYRADHFTAALGDGRRYGLRIRYAHEGPDPLETGGGMLHALPLLGDDPFLVVNGDVWTDFDFRCLPASPAGDAHLVLVDNPQHHPDGDFHLCADGTLLRDAVPRLTFAGIGVFAPRLFEHWRQAVPDAAATGPAAFALLPLLLAAVHRGALHGQHHHGVWTDVGTPQRLEDLDRELRNGAAAPPAKTDP